jgi:multicomponent Na+:H+ antiporter subunit E
MRVVGPVAFWFARAGALAGFFLWELVLANLRVAFDVLTPRHRMRPGIIAVPLAARSDLEITLFANLISLTPGSLSLDVSDDRRVLYVHATYLEDAEALRARVKRAFERRVVELLP